MSTPGWMPPEQSQYSRFWGPERTLYGTTEDDFRFDERTNAFAIGKIMYLFLSMSECTLVYQSASNFVY